MLARLLACGWSSCVVSPSLGCGRRRCGGGRILFGIPTPPSSTTLDLVLIRVLPEYFYLLSRGLRGPLNAAGSVTYLAHRAADTAAQVPLWRLVGPHFCGFNRFARVECARAAHNY